MNRKCEGKHEHVTSEIIEHERKCLRGEVSKLRIKGRGAALHNALTQQKAFEFVYKQESGRI